MPETKPERLTPGDIVRQIMQQRHQFVTRDGLDEVALERVIAIIIEREARLHG